MLPTSAGARANGFVETAHDSRHNPSLERRAYFRPKFRTTPRSRLRARRSRTRMRPWRAGPPRHTQMLTFSCVAFAMHSLLAEYARSARLPLKATPRSFARIPTHAARGRVLLPDGREVAA